MKKALLILVLLSVFVPMVVWADESSDAADTCGGAIAADTCVQYCRCLGTEDEMLPPGDPPRQCICNPLAAEDFNVIVDKIVDFIFNIAIILVPLMAIVAGFLFVTAGGNPEQIKRARDIIIWSAVGLVIVLLSKGIGAIINQILGVRGG